MFSYQTDFLRLLALANDRALFSLAICLFRASICCFIRVLNLITSFLLEADMEP